MTQLSEDRALAMRTLMPRAYTDTTAAATFTADYATLTRSGRAEVDRLVLAFREVRDRALDDYLQARGRCGAPTPALVDQTAEVCALLAEHPGWHRGDLGSEWGARA